MAVILDGKSLSAQIRAKVRQDVEKLTGEGLDVGLALVLVGDAPASKQYYDATIKAGKRVGIKLYEYLFDSNTSINEILNAIHSINRDERINGLLVLAPLPRRMNARRVVNAITPEKDIDGLGAISVGRLAAEESMYHIFSRREPEAPCEALSATGFLPCTPFGVIRLLEHHNVPIKGRHAVVIGKSLAVGKPLSMMFLAKEATLTVCHKATEDLPFYTRQADILCTATGVKGLIRDDMVKEGAVVVDIGIHISPDGSIMGDVDFDPVSKKAGYITPVPGGVGPVTIAMLLENTVKSAQRNAILQSPFTID